MSLLGFVILFGCFGLVLSATSWENWCETDVNVITFEYGSSCDYDTATDWRGWRWANYAGSTDYFEIQNDCCGENRTDTTQNYFTFYDTASSNKDFTFTYVSETSNGRAYLNLTFVPEYPEVPYNFVCEDMADGSIINFQDREADSGVYVVLNLYTKSIYFNVNNGSEHVRLIYGKTVPPFTLINGNATVQIYNQTVIDGCSFRYVGYGTQADSLPSTLGTYFEMKEICSLNGYQRMMICDKGIEDYEDCTCTYENFKYRNSYLDCYHLSEYRIIQFIPNQIQLPSERYWYSFSTTEESYVTVGRNENLTFTGEVVLPDYPIHFSGSVYFNNTLIISRSDVYYDIGDFYISSLQNNVDYDDAILFRGKPISQTTTDLNSMGIQQIGCGASTRRFVSSSSSIDCYCIQNNSTSFKQFDCDDATKRGYDKLDLILSTDYDAGDDHRLWSSIKSQISLTSVTITGTSYIRVENECNFSLIEEVTISVDFTCKKLIISELTHITLVGDIYLSVDSIEFSGDITSKNLNTEAFIKVNSATFDISSALVVDFDSVSSVNCFEFASSTNYFSSDLSSIVDSQFEFLTLGKLLRVCKIGSTNSEVYCELQSETYGDFLYQYCPCENDDCYITTTFTSIDFGSTKTLDYGYLLLDQSTSLLNVVYLHGLKATNILTATINSNREVSIDNVLCNSSYFTLETNCDAIVKPSSAISYKPQSLLTFSSESVNIYDIIETDTGSFVITSTVSSISITQLTGLIQKDTPLFTLEESSSILSVSSIPDNSNSIYRVIGLRVLRDISSPDYYCDEQAIISLPSSSSSVSNDICKELNLYERTCNKVDDGYVNENGDYDYTCPCHSTESDCKIIVGNNVNSMTVDSISDLTVSGSVTLTAYNQYFILRAVGSASDVIEIIGYDNVIFIDGIEGQKFIFSDVNMISIMNGNGVSSTKTNIAKTNTLKTATDLSIYLSSNSYCTEAYISTYFFSFITTYECVRCGGGEVNSDGTCDEKIDVELCTEYATSGICVSCEEGYYVQGYSIGYQTCSSCPSNCKKCTSDGLTVECILCDNGFEISNGRCVKSSTCSNGYIYGMCRTCDEYTYSTNEECNSCIDGCSLCGDNLSCDVCDISEQYLIQSDNQCLKQTTASAVSSNEIIGCISGYYLQNGNCESCSIYGESCTSCNIYGCLECSNNTINIDGNCLLIPNCGNVVNNYCTGCGEKSFFNGIECLSCPTGCSSCTSETSCSNCEDDYWLEENNLCYSTSETTLNIDGCIEIRNGRCIRCSSNMFLNERSCELCDSNCLTCDSFADYCLSCHSNFTIQKDSTSSYCIENEVLNSKCSQMMLSGTGCAICKDGYYRQETDCEECVDNCRVCYSQGTCTFCHDDYYLKNGKQCISYDELTNCLDKTHDGCTLCDNGTYLVSQECHDCSEIESHCSYCPKSSCEGCENDYVLVGSKCYHYKTIQHCSSAENSLCNSCDFWYEVGSDGTYCDKQPVAWVVALIIVFSVTVFVTFIITIIVISWWLIKKSTTLERPDNVNFFLLKESALNFKPLSGKNYIVVDKSELKFDINDGDMMIPVGEETTDVISVGNNGKSKLKVQFTSKLDDLSKFIIHVQPEMVNLKPGEACEFYISIKPTCTCKIEENIQLVSYDYRKGLVVNDDILLHTETKMSTRLDFDELMIEKQIGEGSFGVVYRGSFRGSKVAIKAMKIPDDEEQLEEFEKEVAMLDKFRSPYVVHFLGAVFIPTKICMVTEFAKFGSLMKMITKKKKFNNYLRIKFVLDTARGIEYLHVNGIMHRDIKTDNVLVFSADKGIPVNAKLTDFGSSRNVNMMKSNMTFTQGIGTPMYMAPEVLDQSKYSEKADVFSFAICMFESFNWGTPYPKEEFPFPWNIAEYISTGKRRPRPDTMPEWYYNIISSCWDHQPLNRPNITQIVELIKNDFDEKNFE